MCQPTCVSSVLGTRRGPPNRALQATVKSGPPLSASALCALAERMDKRHILDEIKRTAGANGGVPLGKQRFLTETGIRESDWSGRFWTRWGDAVREAGYEPNVKQAAFEDDSLFEKLALLVRELGHYPVVAELRMKARSDPQFRKWVTNCISPTRPPMTENASEVWINGEIGIDDITASTADALRVGALGA